MRLLSEDETKIFFEKLSKYIGSNIKELLNRQDEDYLFVLQKDRVYYASEELVKKASNFSRQNIISIGVCFGKFTKSGKFRLHITCLDFLAQFAKYKIWLKESAEMSYLYGNHVLKSGLGKITENTPRNQGVVIYSLADIPLGFGTTAFSTQECRKVDGQAIVCYHQADTGEYLRSEEQMLT